MKVPNTISTIHSFKETYHSISKFQKAISKKINMKMMEMLIMFPDSKKIIEKNLFSVCLFRFQLYSFIYSSSF